MKFSVPFRVTLVLALTLAACVAATGAVAPPTASWWVGVT